MIHLEFCEVCRASITNSCNHFGAKVCKACAAFFRRTVSMALKYVCIKDTNACMVNSNTRLVCRFCRLEKCYRVGMKIQMVQSKNVRKRYIRMSKGLLRKNDNVRDFPSELADSSRCMTPQTSNEIPETVKIFRKLEIALIDRRRLLYANCPIRQVFAEQTDVPYEKNNQREFNYKLNQGVSKQDFLMILDYARCVPGFEELNYTDKIYCYRLICTVDYTLNSAYYTYKLGISENHLILADGSGIKMSPEPITGFEENAHLIIPDENDLIKYRTLMPLFKNQWLVCVQFSKLHLTFEEFVLLKGVCLWHVSYYRLSENGREIAKQQRNLLMKSLHEICKNSSKKCSDFEVEARFGNIILGLNYIMEHIRHINCSFVMISFFEILNVDSLMHDVTSFW